MTEIIKFNVGGALYLTSKSTIMIDSKSLLARLISGNVPTTKIEDCIFIDRDPSLFHHVLNYLRNPTIWRPSKVSLDDLLREADFYCLDGMKELLTNIIGKVEIKSMLEFEDQTENIEFRRKFPIVPLVCERNPNSADSPENNWNIYTLQSVHDKYSSVRKSDDLSMQNAQNLLYANMCELHKIGYRIKTATTWSSRNVYIFETKNKSRKIQK